MAIKMRVLYNSAKPKIKNIANEIKAHYDLGVNAVDVIPPAYSCDKERIVILAINIKKSLPDDYRLFLGRLSKAGAANVAILSAGDDACVEKTKELIKEAGANVIEDVKKIKMGLFDNKVSDAEKTEILEWVKNTIASLN